MKDRSYPYYGMVRPSGASQGLLARIYADRSTGRLMCRVIETSGACHMYLPPVPLASETACYHVFGPRFPTQQQIRSAKK